MSELVLRIPKIRTALDRLLEAIQRQHGETVMLSRDMYWHLRVEDAFDMTQEPTTHSVGQLSDDLESVNDFLAHAPGDDGLAAWHELQHLIGVLRALEEVALP